MAEPVGSQPAFAPETTSEHPFAPGELLENRFRIVRELAQGGMGIVYEATDEKLERRIALKCAKLAYRGQLPREARSATEVSHPNVCKIFEIHTARTQFGEIDFLTMEFLDGETLSSRLQRGGLAFEEACAIAREICAGLAEAHRTGVVHGDLKSVNIILSPRVYGARPQAMITDFGLAHRPDATPGTPFAGELGGTRGYMAPELLRGGTASKASDIYALGIVLSEIITACGRERIGQKPSEATRTITTVSLDSLPVEPRRFTVMNSRWERVIAKCVSEDPSARFASADAVARALEPSQRSRDVLVMSALSVLAAVAGLIGYQRMTAPPHAVKLALAPLSVAGLSSADTENLHRGVAGSLEGLRGDRATSFATVRSPDGATHVLQASLQPDAAGQYQLSARILDTKTGVDIRNWNATYKPAELKYLPGGLAGLVTSSFLLPAAAGSKVNARAEPDLNAGLQEVRRPSGADRALPLLTKAVEEDPDSPLTHAGLAEAQWRKYIASNDRQWFENAIESLREAELRNMDLAPVHRIAGLLKANRGRYEQAIEEYKRAIQLDPNSGDSYRRLGMAYERVKQLEQARAAYHQAVTVEPNDFRNHQQLAALEDSGSHFEEALRHFRDALRIAPGEPELHRQLGNEYQSVGNFVEAENEARQALALGDGAKALHSMGVAMLFQGRDREAIPLLQKATEANNPSYLWFANLSVAYRRVGRMEDSRKAIRAGIEQAGFALRINVTDSSARSVLAFLRARQGETQQAALDIGQALQEPPLTSTVSFWAAATYEALDRREDTLNVLNSASPQALALINRWPDVADLHRDAHFQQMLSTRAVR